MADTTYDSFGNVVDVGSDAAASADPTGTAQQYLDWLTSTGSDASSGFSLKSISDLLSGKGAGGTAGQLMALGGIGSLLNSIMGGGGGFAGYKGSIPTYVAQRTMNPIPQTVAAPTAANPQAVAPRRPGSGGITYFTPMQYLTPAQAAAQTPATTALANGGLASLKKYADGGVTDENISSYVNANLNDPAAIAAAAKQYDVSANDISRATGYTGDQINNYFQQAGISPWAAAASAKSNVAEEDNSWLPDFKNASNLKVDPRWLSTPAKGQQFYSPTGYAMSTQPTLDELQRAQALTNQYGGSMENNIFSIRRLDQGKLTPEDIRNQFLAHKYQYSPDEAGRAFEAGGEKQVMLDSVARIYGVPTSDIEYALGKGNMQDLGHNLAKMQGKSVDYLPPFYQPTGVMQATTRTRKAGPRMAYVKASDGTLRQVPISEFDYEWATRKGLDPVEYVLSKQNKNTNFAGGGIASLGSYSDGGQLLRGPGDGVSDSIPATIGGKQPARLADNEFVIPARIVSEIGNGSTDAGARKLYEMMDRVQASRKKSIGKGKIAVDTKAHKAVDKL